MAAVIEARRPELLLPAGSFDSALAAIEGGADALYLGFAEFSARKQARNFDRLEYRRILRFARDRGLRIYAAINTVILESELPAASELLSFLGLFPPDAVIVQDWGLARLLRERHPGIAIHASTQTAIQGAQAARIAAELGATRVILPRETPLAEMRALHRTCPELEFEAFVHGAHCYSYSGLCLASGLLLGRSGNRGECAQVCRSYYDAEPAGAFAGGRGYWFSCRDLDLSARVSALAEAGICSLKIEGRMKSPEYCFAVARLYRSAIDGASLSELQALGAEAETAFSRERSAGWFFERGGERLIDPRFPGHRGAHAGTILRASDGRASIELHASLGLRDGLLAFGGKDQTTPIQFSVSGLSDPKQGRPLSSAKAGDIVEIDCPGSPRPGSELRRISDRRQDRRAASPEEYPPALAQLPLRLKLDREFGEGRLSAELGLPRLDGRGGIDRFIHLGAGETLRVEPSRKPGGFLKAVGIFSESGDQAFRLQPEGGLEDLADLFIPPSALKREKNRIYAEAGDVLEKELNAYASVAIEPKDVSSDRSMNIGRGSSERPRIEAPPRAALSFARDGLPSGMPFATSAILRSEAPLPKIGSISWLPLMPLVADPEEYRALVSSRVQSELVKGESLAIGLDSLHHIGMARKLLEERGNAGKGIAFFIDIHLYTANRLALAAFDSLLPRIAFAYAYLEAPAQPLFSAHEGSPQLASVGPGFEAPLFMSLACLLKHHAADGACPPNCGRSWASRMADRDGHYIAIVEDCVTMLYRA